MTTLQGYKGRRVLVTGGHGFIGSHVCEALLKAGARVTSVDCFVPGLGGRPDNLAEHERLTLIRGDLRDDAVAQGAVRGQEIIFHLAGQSGHARSMEHPREDLELNAGATLSLLRAVIEGSPQAPVVFASTRQVYGRARGALDEGHPTSPPDINAVHNLATEGYLAVFGRTQGLRWTALRLSNTYGSRQSLNPERGDVLGAFLRAALRGESLSVFGTGEDRRVFSHVRDVVPALLRAGAHAGCHGRVWNVGGPAVSIGQLAATLAGQTGVDVVHVPFPAGRAKIDVGDHALVDDAFRQETGWAPVVTLEDGLQETLAAFRAAPGRWGKS